MFKKDSFDATSVKMRFLKLAVKDYFRYTPREVTFAIRVEL